MSEETFQIGTKEKNFLILTSGLLVIGLTWMVIIQYLPHIKYMILLLLSYVSATMIGATTYRYYILKEVQKNESNKEMARQPNDKNTLSDVQENHTEN